MVDEMWESLVSYMLLIDILFTFQGIVEPTPKITKVWHLPSKLISVSSLIYHLATTPKKQFYLSFHIKLYIATTNFK